MNNYVLLLLKKKRNLKKMKIVFFIILFFISINTQTITCSSDERISLTKSTVIGTPVGNWIWQTSGNDKVIKFIKTLKQFTK